MNRTVITVSVLLLCAFSLPSCLGLTDTLREQNIFTLTITIPDAGRDHIVGSDTLIVIGYKMFIDTLSVRKHGGNDEKFEPKLLLASYVFGFSEYYHVASGPVRGGTFNGIRYAVVRPSGINLEINEQDLVERDATTGRVIDTYSIAVIGIYNGNFFRFRSKISRTVQYDFLNSIRLADFNGYLEARLRGNWRQWFLNAQGNGILNPNDPANREQIEANLLKYFDIFTFAIGEIP